MRKFRYWIGVIALAICGLVAVGVWSPSSMLGYVDSETTQEQKATSSQQRSAANPEAELTRVPHSEKAKPSIAELSLRLISTTVAADVSRQRAVILDLKNQRRQLVRVKDRLLSYSDVFVEVIEPLRVKISVAGEPQWLTLDVQTPVQEDAFTMPVEWWSALADKDPNTLNDEQRNDLYVEGLAKLRRMQLGRREPDYQIVQGSFAPWKEKGEMIGIFASRIDRGGIFDQLGVEERDVIVDVNGQAVRTPEDTLKLMEYFAHDSEILVSVRRNGRELTLESHLAPS